jgi:glutamyl-Q tRNA(Asp) synthetase
MTADMKLRDQPPRKAYRGRFAPSPTGPLHFGSLVAAVGSYLDARHHCGEWLLRIEDIDPPREVPGATQAILRTIEQFGMQWDGPVVYQSRRKSLYESALETLHRCGAVYDCACTRREIADSAIHGDAGPVYPGTCRNGMPPGRKARSLRVVAGDSLISVHDRLQGRLQHSLREQTGDFVVRRADRLVAYQLAVVIDDAEQGITHVVRGADLLDSTPRQVHLQQLLGYARPEYAHLPVATNLAGEKLSKQTRARHIDTDNPVATLREALEFLQQPLPDEAQQASLDELWQWAIEHWTPASIPGRRSLPAPAAWLDDAAPASTPANRWSPPERSL